MIIDSDHTQDLRPTRCVQKQNVESHILIKMQATILYASEIILFRLHIIYLNKYKYRLIH